MPIQIHEVTSKKDLKKFVKFQNEIYKGNQYYVPPLIRDEIETFTPGKNPAYETCDSKLFLAYDGEKIVGRIAGIMNHAANNKWKTKNIRFGWFETIDDFEVAHLLFDSVAEWGREQGMETMTGPHGFSDLDQEGMLVEGFDKLATIATYYHHPYYWVLTERCGFVKDVDFMEFISKPPYEEGIPKNLLEATDWIKKRYSFRVPEYKSVKDYKRRAKELFHLLEESFEDNYGTVPLTETQVDYYVKKYISYIHKELIKIVVNDKDEMIGFLITMPNLSKAFQKAKGKLLPTGIFHILKAYKKSKVLDFYLAGVKKAYRGKGVDVLMVIEIVKSAMKLGFIAAESNPELEDNRKVQGQWKFFNPVMHKRRRIYKKSIILINS